MPAAKSKSVGRKPLPASRKSTLGNNRALRRNEGKYKRRRRNRIKSRLRHALSHTSNREEAEMYKIDVEVNKEYVTALQKFLDEKNVQYDRVVRKALDFPELIMIAAPSLTVVKLIYDFFREKRNKNERIQININVNVNDININLMEIHPEEIDKKIKEIEDKLKK